MVLLAYSWHHPRKERRRPALPTLRKRFAGLPNAQIVDAALDALEEVSTVGFDSAEFVNIARFANRPSKQTAPCDGR